MKIIKEKHILDYKNYEDYKYRKQWKKDTNLVGGILTISAIITIIVGVLVCIL